MPSPISNQNEVAAVTVGVLDVEAICFREKPMEMWFYCWSELGGLVEVVFTSSIRILGES